jgi:hypothetical protein
MESHVWLGTVGAFIRTSKFGVISDFVCLIPLNKIWLKHLQNVMMILKILGQIDTVRPFN